MWVNHRTGHRAGQRCGSPVKPAIGLIESGARSRSPASLQPGRLPIRSVGRLAVVAAQLLAQPGPRRAIVLISARHIDGARRIGRELAATFADLGRQVLVIGDAVAEPSSLSRVPANAACFLTCRPAVTRAYRPPCWPPMVLVTVPRRCRALFVRHPAWGDPCAPQKPAASTGESAEPERGWPRIDVFENLQPVDIQAESHSGGDRIRAGR